MGIRALETLHQLGRAGWLKTAVQHLPKNCLPFSWKEKEKKLGYNLILKDCADYHKLVMIKSSPTVGLFLCHPWPPGFCLGPISKGAQGFFLACTQIIIPGGAWRTKRSAGDWTLVQGTLCPFYYFCSPPTPSISFPLWSASLFDFVCLLLFWSHTWHCSRVIPSGAKETIWDTGNRTLVGCVQVK